MVELKKRKRYFVCQILNFTGHSSMNLNKPLPELPKIYRLLSNNKKWAIKTTNEHPDIFLETSKQQNPEVLWIGCSDSRVNPTDLLDVGIGDVFITRNIANIVTTSDLSLLSVLQYAVEVLKVKHICCVGHYRCGGVAAVLSGNSFGLIDNWLTPIADLRITHKEKLNEAASFDEMFDILVELNVKTSMRKIVTSGIVNEAWKRNQELVVHAWVYCLDSGLIKDLECDVASPVEAHLFKV